MASIPIGQLKRKLISEELITPEIFDNLLRESEQKNEDLLDLLVAENVVTPDYLNSFLTANLGVERAGILGQALDESVVHLLPEDIAKTRQAVVFKAGNGEFKVAMANPDDLESIKFISQYLGGPVRAYLATKKELFHGFSFYGHQLSQDFKRAIEEKIQLSLRDKVKSVEEAAADLPVVDVVDSLLSYALSLRASDVHLEILEDVTLVRYRIDGILYEIMQVNKAIHPALVARIKLLAGLKLDEHYKPQDGRFRHRIINKVLDIRVSVIPTFYGEKVEMRLLENTEKPLTLEELGMSDEQRKIVMENLSKAYGMILICGPTGAGKTTTLYSFMNILNKPEVNITAIEDPIEYNMRYVNQIQINPQAGITFASGLRAILRQDPNVIMVGEIRDEETAGISVQAALTGHLLLSSLHTNDAPTVIPRLSDLGVQSFLVSSVLNLAIAQRLVRKVCQACVYSYNAGSDLVGMIAGQLETGTGDKRIPKTFYRGKGCEACGFSGYKGRLGIFEILEISEETRHIISDPGFTLAKLEKAAADYGMRSMFEDGLLKVQLAITTIEEVIRVIKE